MAASTPNTRTDGLIALTAVAIPEISPPPPIGTTTSSRSGTSWIISRPVVPWPAMMSWSSKAETKIIPRSASIWWAVTAESSRVSPVSTISAPKPRVCSTFTVGVASGMQISAFTPRRLAWQASAWAWLPAEAVITPRARSASLIISSLLQAPRSLKDAGELLVLLLDPDVGAGEQRQLARMAKLGALHVRGDALGRGQDIVEGKAHAASRKVRNTRYSEKAALSMV